MREILSIFCGTNDGSNMDEILAAADKAFTEKTGWKQNSDGMHVCPTDDNAGIKLSFSMTTSNTLNTGFVAYSRESSSEAWTVSAKHGGANISNNGACYLQFYLSKSGGSFAAGFGTSASGAIMNCVCAMLDDEDRAGFMGSPGSILQIRSLTATISTSHIYGVGAFSGAPTMTMITLPNVTNGGYFKEFVKVVSYTGSFASGDLIYSGGNYYRATGVGATAIQV